MQSDSRTAFAGQALRADDEHADFAGWRASNIPL
jgi:hypothetical protein